MKYLGSKNRVAKEIIPLITKHLPKETTEVVWIEPFVGGGNMIDKINPQWTRAGYDINPHTIKALETIMDCPESIPENLSEEEYKNLKGKEPELVSSLLRFIASYGGKFDNGFARGGLNSDGSPRNHVAEGKRNAVKQSKNLQGVCLNCGDYTKALAEAESAPNKKEVIVYCDPPYFNTTKYKTEEFPHIDFWLDLLALKTKRPDIKIFVSEYSVPDEILKEHRNKIKEVWCKQVSVNLDSNRKCANSRTEKLFEVI